MDIWQKCPRTSEVLRIEEKVSAFLRAHKLAERFSLREIENWIYNCPLAGEDRVFDPLLEALHGYGLKDLLEFEALFREELFPQVPQRILNGLSPVRYALNLKKLQG